MKLAEILEQLEQEHNYNDNSARAVRGAEKVRGHSGCEDDDESNVTDLLTDIRHYCDAMGLDYGRLNNRARSHHEAEVAEDGLAKKIWED